MNSVPLSVPTNYDIGWHVYLASPLAFDTFRDFPCVWRVFGQRAAIVRELPQRVYGGLGQALYTKPCVQIPGRPKRWRHRGGVLCSSAPGGWVFQTSVHLELGKVELTVKCCRTFRGVAGFHMPRVGVLAFIRLRRRDEDA